MFTHKNLMTVCCAAVLAFGLAACGSSSSDDDKVPVTKTDVTDVTDVTAPTTEQMTAAAATKVMAIGVEGKQTTDAGLGGIVPLPPEADDEAVDPSYVMTIKRDRDGTTVEIEDPANAGDDDPKFIKQDVDLGVGRTMHVRTMPENEDGEVVEEVVIVKTDIKAPKATLFAKVPGGAQELTVDKDGMMAGGRNATALDLTGGLTAEVNAAVLANIMASEFAAAAGTTVMHSFNRVMPDDITTVEVDESKAAAEVEGTFNGAMGTYKCTGTDADCTVVVNGKGMLTATTGAWIFTPDPGAKSDVADAEYLHYGFWLMKTTKDGETTYNEVETFAGSKLEASVEAGIETVEGSATYEGGSVGVYVKNVLDDQANIDSATSGHFSADVELTANFGGGNVPDNNKFTIEGTVTDFVLQHGEENDWAVKLGLAGFSGRTGMGPGKEGPGSDFTNTFNGETTGDSTVLGGTWSGAFHGLTPLTPTDDDAATVTVAPGTVVGEFNANFTDGIAAGGFGAKKQ